MNGCGLLGSGGLGNIQGQLANALNQQQQQVWYQNIAYTNTAASNVTYEYIPAGGGSFGLATPAKPKTNLAWLDEDIARYRVKLAA